MSPPTSYVLDPRLLTHSVSVCPPQAPQLLGFEDICPAREACPDCASMGPVRCENSARMFGVGISAFDPSLPGVENRTEDCILETIGKPVFKR